MPQRMPTIVEARRVCLLPISWETMLVGREAARPIAARPRAAVQFGMVLVKQETESFSFSMRDVAKQPSISVRRKEARTTMYPTT